MPPYDVDREYAEHLDAEARRAEEKAARERADNDPAVAKRRAEATRAADVAQAQKRSKLPRVGVRSMSMPGLAGGQSQTLAHINTATAAARTRTPPPGRSRIVPGAEVAPCNRR